MMPYSMINEYGFQLFLPNPIFFPVQHASNRCKKYLYANDYMLLLRIDISTSSVKVAIEDALSQQTIAQAQHPRQQETQIISNQPCWAQPVPDFWWQQDYLKIDSNWIPAFQPVLGICGKLHGIYHYYLHSPHKTV